MMTDKTKSWDEIQEDFDRMQRMSCVPVDIKKVPENYVFDENQSVKWNKEQVKINNRKYKEEVARLNTLKNKARDSVYEDIYRNIEVKHYLDEIMEVV